MTVAELMDKLRRLQSETRRRLPDAAGATISENSIDVRVDDLPSHREYEVIDVEFVDQTGGCVRLVLKPILAKELDNRP